MFTFITIAIEFNARLFTAMLLAQHDMQEAVKRACITREVHEKPKLRLIVGGKHEDTDQRA